MADRYSPEALRYAVAVADTRSFSAAARAHAVSQPALSNAVARLEEQLGERLFDRSTRGAVPTAFAERLLPLLRRAVESLDALSAEARRLTAQGKVTIRVGVSPVIDSALVADLYTTAGRGDASRDIVLREANMADLREGLRAGDLDVILIPSVGPIPRFEHRIVDSEPVVVVQSAPSEEKAVGLSELQDQPLLLIADTCGLTRFTMQLFEGQNLIPRRYPGEATSYRVLEEWARMGLGVAILPESKLAPNGEASAGRRSLREDDGEVEIFYEAVWDPTSALAAEFRALADALAGRPRRRSAA